MISAPDVDAASTTRERIVRAAAELTTSHGWAWVTMTKLAGAVGVSRQTVYNEIGTKSALAEAMVLHELDRFLELVNNAFDECPDDLIGAVREASRAVLVFAEGNLLLRAVVSATHGADTELLPLLTTHSQSLLGAAKLVVTDRVADYDIRLDAERLSASIDVVVRLVLSHVMQPSDTPERTARDIAWTAERVLRP